ncbi:hypothetical protein HMP09_3218 [Sphingomonas sp. HMP9]|nr:hypothetical protein HMP09_3218 [Sphingomonas sp. HMP9]
MPEVVGRIFLSAGWERDRRAGELDGTSLPGGVTGFLEQETQQDRDYDARYQRHEAVLELVQGQGISTAAPSKQPPRRSLSAAFA